MSSFDKVVKLACKPKPAPPKAKYLDPIIAATWSEDGAVHDVCKALVPRLREPNAIVAFKALIVLHTMIRNGATDNVLSHLSSSEVLRLRNVSGGNWEGYNAPQNMQHYALYLDSRIRAYRELKHDAIRVQAESNRDLRLHNAIEEDMAYPTAPQSKASSNKSKAPQRSKTIMGRKLRVMTVEKGLLRETKTVQKMIDSLVECRFYLDDLEDELTITALRMLVKDLLILFQAGNEGVINVLEHYFEMSKYDAEEALSIYRGFCGQTERVVEYLGVAKKLQNLLNVPIPNLKHAPVSLASSLQDYLNDPNFEQNRIEYKVIKAAAERNPESRSGAPSAQVPGGATVTSANSTSNQTLIKPQSVPPVTNSKPTVDHAAADFFGSIEEEQTPVFNPVTSSPTSNHLQQQTAHNPFVQRQTTGAPTSQSGAGQVQIQSMGFPSSFPFQIVQPFQAPQQLLPPQPDSFATQSLQAPQHRPFSAFVPQQTTGVQLGSAAGFPQLQFTGANPFRQSVLVPQATGMPAFNTNGVPLMPPLSAPQTEFPFSMTNNVQLQSPAQPMVPFVQAQHPAPSSTQFGRGNSSSEVPVRPASTPLTGIAANPSPPVVQPVRSHQTGSRNPFGVPVALAPPVPKPPTLLELSMGAGRPTTDSSQPPVQSHATSPQVPSTTIVTTESTFSTVASSFAFGSRSEENPSFLNSLSNPQPTGVPLPSQRVNSGGLTPGVGLRPQATGALGAANPFRATMFAMTSSPPTISGGPSMPVSSASMPPFGGLNNGTRAFSPFGPGFGNGTLSMSLTHFGQDASSMQQQNAGTSLI